MRLFVLSLFSALTQLAAQAQDALVRTAEEISRRGEALYLLERASWLASDKLMLATGGKFPPAIGGYFSYRQDTNIRAIFYTKDEWPKVHTEFIFDSQVRTDKPGEPDRLLTWHENEIVKMRRAALSVLASDSFFKWYERMNFNTVPLMEPNRRLVYVLSGPEEPGIMIMGNDYLLEFDDAFKLIGKKKLHEQMTVIRMDDTSGLRQFVNTHQPRSYDNLSTAHIHSDADSPFMTETDICTLRLYGFSEEWRRHAAVSRDYASDWDCKEQKLVIVPLK